MRSNAKAPFLTAAIGLLSAPPAPAQPIDPARLGARRAFQDAKFGMFIHSDPVQVLVDNTPPDLTIAVAPFVLWPPNHKLVPVSVTVNVHDAIDPRPTVRLESVVCDDGCTAANDVTGATVGTDDRQLALRAERSGTGAGRTYTITYVATDASGNSRGATSTVVVPHDLRAR